MYFLDTNICIYLLKGSFLTIAERMKMVSSSQIKIPSVVEAELYFGAEKSSNPQRALQIVEKFLFPFEIIAFGKESSRIYAKIRSKLESKGPPIGPNDLFIASTVIGNNGVLITHNVSEFSRIQGLEIQDWCVNSKN